MGDRKNYLLVRSSNIANLVEAVSNKRIHGWDVAGGVVIDYDDDSLEGDIGQKYYVQALIRPMSRAGFLSG